MHLDLASGDLARDVGEPPFVCPLLLLQREDAEDWDSRSEEHGSEEPHLLVIGAPILPVDTRTS
jgi:hypothetical protein